SKPAATPSTRPRRRRKRSATADAACGSGGAGADADNRCRALPRRPRLRQPSHRSRRPDPLLRTTRHTIRSTSHPGSDRIDARAHRRLRAAALIVGALTAAWWAGRSLAPRVLALVADIHSF